MAKYNKKTQPLIQKTVTHQGGVGYTQKPEHELVGILAYGLENTFYENESEREERFKNLISNIASKDKEFVAKALVYARTVYGQRSVTHFGAVELAPFLSGDNLGKRFFSKRDRRENKGGIVYRLDDMSEILAAYFAKNGKNAPIPNAIKRGFKEAIENSDKYELAKYQMKGKEISLVDIVNLVHPSQTEKQGFIEVSVGEYLKSIKGTKWEPVVDINGKDDKDTIKIPTLHALILGLLKQFNTVEDKNTESGKIIAEKVIKGDITEEEAEIELNKVKSENFLQLIKSKKIGYLALLRNLRNIIKTENNDLIDEACNLLKEPEFIKKSLVFPHQIDLALEIIMLEFSGIILPKVIKALNDAYELSIPNLKELFPSGRTAVVFDSSGSMSSYIKLNRRNGASRALDKAALIAATLGKGLNADVYHFSSICEKLSFNPLDTINTIKRDFISKRFNSGTLFSSIFEKLFKYGAYDRVFIISDEQGADSLDYSYKKYVDTFGKPHIYFINICGYSPTVIKQDTRIHRIYGYNSDIYETAKRAEMDINTVIKEINSIRI